MVASRGRTLSHELMRLKSVSDSKIGVPAPAVKLNAFEVAVELWSASER